ncbi:ATP-dependent helicase [Salmonella enterica]|uniref:DEAD/DEAH box helicase n=1 Tax=Salmonella enterica TaxID=28901 RepID=A0A5U2M2C6_SALER|nr:ATP-dependent helicase [Salmonella enterica]EBS6148965.1 ATP-dependent helicase [Salmonella enterica subsp. enterica serovar Inganda]EBP0903439.1 DEAD/DEAH box helicase [Salmonella enterica]EBP0916933.1 DEAD/DEAH box helicase [Salmonella enterica]EBP1003223.1 DEAD/DEAH box helicase [Salmonella enterica]
MIGTTPYHAKYFAHELSILHSNNGVDRLSQSLFDTSVDLNPHQIEAALFAIENPLSKGVVLADEVGLGKTIEAGLVLCQYWAERKRKLLIICPASLRRQWASELIEKFNLPSQVLDAKTFSQLQKEGVYNPLNNKSITIMSFHYAARLEEKLVAEMWDLVVIDEAHKLRNAHRDSNKMGQALKRALYGRKKLLLTATPLQNSLMELYGISALIDEHTFGDPKAFRKQYMQTDRDMVELKGRLAHFIKRTLRKNVLEYVKYTERKAITIPFYPSEQEHELYERVQNLLEREDSYALPKRHRHLTGLILRKLLSSSTKAVLNNLQILKIRLEKLKQKGIVEDELDIIQQIIVDDDLEDDIVEDDEILSADTERKTIDLALLQAEINELETLIFKAEQIGVDTKTKELLLGLEQGFAQLAEMGAAKKVIIFTESMRTQQYLARFLENHGYLGRVVTFSGTNNTPQTNQIYQQWLEEYRGSSRITGSAQIDKRSALIDHFKDHAEIMIATEAAAEGVNLQFCSLLINYDLPWNPQRIEQRIGRCHRYGQEFDVVVINFLNQRNQADQRVMELLTEKFNLFDGVFGASDSVLGSIENGVDFEKKIQSIYESCRTPEEIEAAFEKLRKELEDEINLKMQKTQEQLLEHFDEDIHDVLKIRLDETQERLDKVGRWFWAVTHYQLKHCANFDHEHHRFTLYEPVNGLPVGQYQLLRRSVNQKSELQRQEHHSFAYRINHPLGEYVIDNAKRLDTEMAEVIFNYSDHATKVSVAEQLKGQAGWLTLNLLTVDAFNTQQFLVFTAKTDRGQIIDGEACKRLFQIAATPGDRESMSAEANTLPDDLLLLKKRQIDTQLAEVMEQNNALFELERDKLEKWAEDVMYAAEEALRDTKMQIKSLKRDARLAQSIEEQKQNQERLKQLERQQKRQRMEIFDIEDEISDKRDLLISALEERMKQKTEIAELFTIRWKVI